MPGNHSKRQSSKTAGARVSEGSSSKRSVNTALKAKGFTITRTAAFLETASGLYVQAHDYAGDVIDHPGNTIYVKVYPNRDSGTPDLMLKYKNLADFVAGFDAAHVKIKKGSGSHPQVKIHGNIRAMVFEPGKPMTVEMIEGDQLSWLQARVGGYIEGCAVDARFSSGVLKFYADEEGRPKHMTANMRPSPGREGEVLRYFPTLNNGSIGRVTLVGTVVAVNEIGDDLYDLTADMIESYKEF